MINVFSAHPDDCEISLGGFLLSLKTPFRVIYATKGEVLSGDRDPQRFFRKKAEIFYLGEKDCGIENTITLRKSIEIFLGEGLINIVHWPQDSHKDHRQFSEAVYDACRGKNILYYQSVSAKKFLPNLKIKLEAATLDRKIKRLQKAFKLDRYYLKDEFLMKNLEGDFYYEYLHVEDLDLDLVKMLSTH